MEIHSTVSQFFLMFVINLHYSFIYFGTQKYIWEVNYYMLYNHMQFTIIF